MDKSDQEKQHAQEWEGQLAAGLKGLRAEIRGRLKHFPSQEFHTHMRAARRETLLAIRSLLDQAIEQTKAPPEEPKASRIVIE